MNRLQIKKNEAIARALASFSDYGPTVGNVKAVNRRCPDDFEQNPYRVRDAILQAIQAGELTPKTAPKSPVAPPKQSDQRTDIKEQIAFVEKVLNEFPKYRSVESNLAQILPLLEGQPFCAESVRQAISKCAAQRKLGINSDYREAFRQFWDQHPEYAMAANEELLARAFDEHIGPDGVFSVEALNDLLKDEVVAIRPKLALTLPAQRRRHLASPFMPLDVGGKLQNCYNNKID